MIMYAPALAGLSILTFVKNTGLRLLYIVLWCHRIIQGLLPRRVGEMTYNHSA